LWNLLDTPLRFGVYDIWGDLDREHKLELLSKARSEDTMRAWEIHLAEKPRK
jgi:hypothetical protein